MSETCCIVGAGPGGAILALLLARQGIKVTLLEAHEDFDRDFRGDTIHPSVLNLMDEIGLADRLLQLRHSRVHTARFSTPDGPIILADFRRIETKFPYIMITPQSEFLKFIADETQRYPSFQLLMGASAQELIEEDGIVRGVRYRSGDDWHEIRAALTVGADGRSSRIRRLAGFEPIKTSPPMDVLWFRIPRESTDPEGILAYFGRGHGLVLLDRLTEWQVGFIILKGSFSQIRAAGLEALRGTISELLTEFPDRIKHLQDWKQVAVLSVESSRVPQWYKPGLLLIGDAAHVMSPVGGVGINYAIQDAVVAANVLTDPLKAVSQSLRAASALTPSPVVQRGGAQAVSVDYLREVQRQREFPTRAIQWIQSQVQKRVIGAALRSDRPLQIPWPIRLLLHVPLIRDIPARIIAHGIKRVRLENRLR
ncbi:MAG TPA: FAD-dependent oxidoreductase [Pyrinomonadaceae bacterium]|nr:FAD-dependent oxidoreductase [Pyrinomonadaceae bacterium]